jgi:hypothetical protein
MKRFGYFQNALGNFKVPLLFQNTFFGLVHTTNNKFSASAMALLKFLSLSLDCLIQIVRDWIILHELTLLDSAICCKKGERDYFLYCLSFPTLVFNGYNHQIKDEICKYHDKYGILTTAGISIAFYKWLKVRHLKLNRLILFNNSVPLALLLDLGSITKIYFHYDLLNSDFNNDDDFHKLVSKCPELEELYFWHDCPLFNFHEELLKHCPKLKIVSHDYSQPNFQLFSLLNPETYRSRIQICFSESTVCDSHVEVFTKHCSSQLMSTKFFNCTGVTDLSILMVVRRCYRTLTELAIIDCENVTDEAFTMLDPIECNNLSSLSLAYGRSFSNTVFERVSALFSNLTSICLKFCLEVRDDGILKLCQKCVLLTDVDISFMPNITSRSAKFIARYLLGVRSVCIHQSESNVHVSMSMYSILMQTAANPKRISWIDEYRMIKWRSASLLSPEDDVSHVGGFGGVFISSLVKSCDLVNNMVPIFQDALFCKELRKLTYVRASLDNTLYGANLFDVLSRCDCLVVLHLMSGFGGAFRLRLSEQFCDTIAMHCFSLEVLHMSNFPCVSFLGLTAICASNPRLLVVEVPNCNLDDDAVFAISHGCKHLQLLDVSCNEEVADASMYSVMDCCLLLTSLDVHGTSVSDVAIKELNSACKCLRRLISNELIHTL